VKKIEAKIKKLEGKVKKSIKEQFKLNEKH